MNTMTMEPGAVVVAADGSQHSDRALQWAAEQAYLERRRLAVVTAAGWDNVRLAAWPGAVAVQPDIADQMLEGARAVARQAAGRVRELRPGLTVEEHAALGDPRQVLVGLSTHAHLLVLGSHGRGSVSSRLLGSVSAAVARHANCPVVVCRPGPHVVKHGVLVGADGTPESRPVIEHAFQQASLRGLPLTVMHAYWDVAAALMGPGVMSRTDPAFGEQRVLLSESVAGFAEKFPDVHVTPLPAHGLAQDCLTARSGRWDLVVVGRHPLDSLSRLVAGSVATTVLERAETVVAVVPQPAGS